MNLPPEAHSIVVGSLLGDGYLTRNGSLQIEHCLNHADYALWKYEILRCIAGKPPRTIERWDRRTVKTYRSVRFYTKSVLKLFRNDFYRDGKKVVPISIGDILDPLAIAVWFMDDGGRGARTPRGLVINTSCFSLQEQGVVQSVLGGRFGIETSIHKVGSGFQLYIRACSFLRFSEMIAPYLVAPMRYKLPVDPVTTSPPRRRDSGFVRESEPNYSRYDTSALTRPVR